MKKREPVWLLLRTLKKGSARYRCLHTGTRLMVEIRSLTADAKDVGVAARAACRALNAMEKRRGK